MRRVLPVLLVLVACSTTKIDYTWTSPTKGALRVRQFAVLGVGPSPSGRIQFEEALTKALAERGLPAFPGYDFVTYDEHPPRDEVIRRLRARGLDGALVTRVTGRNVKTESTPVWVGGSVANPFYGGFYDYWYAPGGVATYTTEESETVVETVLYALEERTPLWAARSVTRRRSPGDFARDLGGAVADDLRKAGVLKDFESPKEP